MNYERPVYRALQRLLQRRANEDKKHTKDCDLIRGLSLLNKFEEFFEKALKNLKKFAIIELLVKILHKKDDFGIY